MPDDRPDGPVDHGGQPPGGIDEAAAEQVSYPALRQPRPAAYSQSPDEQRQLTILDPWQEHVVPPFPLDALPPVLARFVAFQARSLGADPSAIAMGTLAACSGALDHRFALKMMVNGNWWAHPRVWVGLVGAVSCKKTPVVQVCTEPIRAAQSVLAERHRESLAKDATGMSARDKPKEPEPRIRYIANDVTVEKLADLLARPGQERGLLVVRDELAGWLGGMEKYTSSRGGMADRGFWLTAYNGGPYHVDRISRGSSYVPNLSVSFLGCIQPERLAEIGNLSSDGLLQRFLPVMMTDAALAEDIPDGGAVAAYDALLTRLLGLRGCAQFMDADALQAAADFRGWLHDVEHLGLGAGFSAFIGKLQGVHGSLSLILHLAADPKEAMYDKVSASTVTAAERIIREFVIPHAQALYQESVDGVGWDDLRVLCSFVLTHDKERFTTSDFTSNIASLRGLAVWPVFQKVSPLVAAGWLIEEGESAPARAWTVVAGLRGRFAERRQTEKRRKAEAMAAFHHPAHRTTPQA